MTAQWKTMSRDERTAAVNECIHEGLTSAQAAERLGASRGGIIGHCRRHCDRHFTGGQAAPTDGAPPVKVWKTMDRAERLAAIADAIANGKTVAHVGETYGISGGAVSKFAVRYAPVSFCDRQDIEREELRRAVPGTWRAMTTEERVAALKAAASAGDSMQVAADRLKAPLQTVKNFCARHLNGFFRAARVKRDRAQRKEAKAPLRAPQAQFSASPEERDQANSRAPVPPAIPGGVAFIALEHHHCRAPLWSEEKGAADDYRFCGGRQREGSAYCDAHHARMHADPGDRTGPRTGAIATMATSRVRVRTAGAR